MTAARLPRYAERAVGDPRIRRVWQFRQADRDTTPVRILPDGCVDVIWDGTQLCVAGPDTIAAWADVVAGTTLTGVRLAPGVAEAVFGVPMHALRDQRVALRDLWGARSDALAARLAERAERPALAVRLLQDAVTTLPAAPDPLMAQVFARLAGTPTSRIAALARDLGIGERQLHRRCLSAFGYCPKTLDRILRLQRLLALAPRQASLTAAAHAAGYADASHLVREAQHLAGLAPGALVRQHAHGSATLLMDV